jgi:hypothetical protein
MSNTQAYTKAIGFALPTNSPQDESGSTLGDSFSIVGQTSPTWVLSFVRWEYRDLLRTPTNAPYDVRKTPLVVENDCVQLSVADNKGVLTPNMSAVLVETDINYSTSVHPGDFVFVNILNWESDARAVADKARLGKPINGQADGFKGFFKVQSVRKKIRVDPITGTKTVLITIDAFAFTEFNNTIYFNPNLINYKDLQNVGLYTSNVGGTWASYVSRSGRPFVQVLLTVLIQSLIGTGTGNSANQVSGLVVSPNTQFLVPTLVGNLLGIKNAVSAKDLYSYIFGIQLYSSGQSQELASGMNPSNLQSSQIYPGFYYTNQFCAGNSLLKPEYWNQVKLWSILNQYTNAPLNEIYTCFKVSPNGSIMPTLIFRQIPFTSPDFPTQTLGVQDGNAPTIPVTQFLTLPRWKIGAESVFELDLGTDEAARVNFVQYYAASNFSKKGTEMAAETALRNYTYDQKDVTRSGLRPVVVQNQFDDTPDRLVYAAPVWARIYGDAVMGGHLRLNGTITCIGIVDPIAVGDNLEFNDTVFHIEQIQHACSINPLNGIKSFRTVLSLSHGIDVSSSSQGTIYSEMTYPNAYADRAADHQLEQILPGVSESQDIVQRDSPNNVDTPRGENVPFPQPALTPSNPNKPKSR